jgi:hypothetical protein
VSDGRTTGAPGMGRGESGAGGRDTRRVGGLHTGRIGAGGRGVLVLSRSSPLPDPARAEREETVRRKERQPQRRGWVHVRGRARRTGAGHARAS